MNNTKNNHFVPQGYLKNFLNDKLSLYKYDLDNSLKKKLHMKKYNFSVN